MCFNIYLLNFSSHTSCTQSTASSDVSWPESDIGLLTTVCSYSTVKFCIIMCSKVGMESTYERFNGSIVVLEIVASACLAMCNV